MKPVVVLEPPEVGKTAGIATLLRCRRTWRVQEQVTTSLCLAQPVAGDQGMAAEGLDHLRSVSPHAVTLKA